MSDADHGRRTRGSRLALACAGLTLVAGMTGLLSVTVPAQAALNAYLYFDYSDSQQFTFTGAEQTYTIPGGATELAITAVGAPGGGGTADQPALGSYGASVTAVVPVSALPSGTTTLYVDVGGNGQATTGGASAGKAVCQGNAPGGFNGGGAGCFGGGGGGGASDVRTTSIQGVPDSLISGANDSRIVVAGGGGGEGGQSTAGTACNGGTAGDGTAGGPGPGGDGTGSASLTCSGGDGGFGGAGGGAAGAGATATQPASGGGLAVGGDGGGSGGGGGYFGGGAGGCCTQVAGGGAGSSFWIPAATSTSMTQDGSGDAEVTITPGFGDTESMTQPASVTTDATSPQGAAVDYPLPVATDAAGVTTPSVSCAPGPGSVFPIGTTEVTCTAVDADASPSSVIVQFAVTVNGAMPQLADLGQAVHGVSGGKALGAIITGAQSALTAGRPWRAWTWLRSSPQWTCCERATRYRWRRRRP